MRFGPVARGKEFQRHVPASFTQRDNVRAVDRSDLPENLAVDLSRSCLYLRADFCVGRAVDMRKHRPQHGVPCFDRFKLAGLHG